MPSELSLAAQEFEQKKHEKLFIANLYEKLEAALPLNDHVIWGHGTLNKALATTISAEGISANPSYDLFNIATPLTDTDKSAEENIEYIIQQAKNWPHKKSRFIILIGVPHGVRPNNVIEHFESDKGKRTRLPQRFIIGYMDMIKNTFVANPSFEKLAAPTDEQIKQINRLPAQPRLHQETQVIPTPIVGTDDNDEIW